MAEDIIWNLNPRENEDSFPPQRPEFPHQNFRFKKDMKVSKSDICLTLKNLISAK